MSSRWRDAEDAKKAFSRAMFPDGERVVWVIEKRHVVFGMTEYYAEKMEWHNIDTDDDTPPGVIAALETLDEHYDLRTGDGGDVTIAGHTFRRLGVKTEWHPVEMFLTEVGADDYLARHDARCLRKTKRAIVGTELGPVSFWLKGCDLPLCFYEIVGLPPANEYRIAAYSRLDARLLVMEELKTLIEAADPETWYTSEARVPSPLVASKRGVFRRTELEEGGEQ